MTDAVTSAPPEPRIVADVRMIKADTNQNAGSAVRARGWEYEDEFKGLYGSKLSGVSGDVEILEPPYLPRTLEALCQQNNTLNVCISAVVTNIHGTGYDIVAVNEKDATTEAGEPNPRIVEIKAFFDETYPGESFRELRQQVGKDLEKIGHAYIEVIRNLAGQIIFLRRLDPKMMRLIKKDAQRRTKITVTRLGKTFSADVMLRWRRFVQTLSGTNMQYFKQYKCPDPLNCETGKWDQNITVDTAASEIIYLKRDDDSLTSYGVPAWLAQLPSVLGSRKAEELNLQFFDNGGVPPIMVFVNGGALTPQAAAELRRHLQSGSNKHTIPVIETVATGGSIDNPNAVKVTIERFGSERQDDSMFEGYDERCEKRVRRAWRLPPLFIGATDDYNFASAYASYLVAEAQVFAPERQEFDALINRTIMKELDPEGLFEFRSRPINIKDVEKQLAALEIALRGKTLSRKQLIEVLNSMVGFELRLDEEDIASTGAPAIGPTGLPGAEENADEDEEDPAEPGVAEAATKAHKLFKTGGSREEFGALLNKLTSMKKRDRRLFKAALTNLTLGDNQMGEQGQGLLSTSLLSLITID